MQQLKAQEVTPLLTFSVSCKSKIVNSKTGLIKQTIPVLDDPSLNF